jgi:hypothetical protein
MGARRAAGDGADVLRSRQADRRVEDRPDGYRERGDRCEGVWGAQKVGGTLLKIASFTRGEVNYRLDGGPLTLEWPPTRRGEPVHIRAVSLRSNLYYQMDTVQPGEEASFLWPTEVLLQPEIRPDEVGVRGWVEFVWGGRSRELHLPIAIRQGETQDLAGLYQVLVLPELALGTLTGSVERLDEDDGLTGAISEVDLGGLYPARLAIPIEVPIPDKPGIYRLRLVAIPDDGGEPFSTFVWFEHSEP